jgi:hypothetical protein
MARMFFQPIDAPRFGSLPEPDDNRRLDLCRISGKTLADAIYFGESLPRRSPTEPESVSTYAVISTRLPSVSLTTAS